jgi:flagellar motor switch protein FliG
LTLQTLAVASAEELVTAHEDKVATAATLMLILGEEAAANVMKHLSDDEVRQISSRFGAVHG